MRTRCRPAAASRPKRLSHNADLDSAFTRLRHQGYRREECAFASKARVAGRGLTGAYRRL